MQGWTLFLVSVAVYSVLPVLFAVRRSPYQSLLLYTHLAGTLVLGGLLGGFQVFEVGELGVRAGQVAFGGFLFSALVTVVVGRDVQVVRNIVALTVSVHVLVLLILTTGAATFDAAAVEGALRAVLVGGVLVVLGLLLLLAVLEVAKSRVSSRAMPLVYVVTFAVVAALDAVLRPATLVTPTDDLLAGVREALTVAAAYSVPLLAFVLLRRRAVEDFEAQPLDLSHLVTVSRAELMERLERQQSELKAQSDELKESSEPVGGATATVDRILDSATNTFLMSMDPKFRITKFNAGAQRLLGWEAADVTGLSPVMFHNADEVARQAEELHTAADYSHVVMAQVATGKRRDWEFVTRDGQVHVISLSITEIVVGSRSLGYLAAGEDVTGRLRAENAVKTALRREHEAVVRLQEVNRVKQDLVSTVSHELRTPITSIHGYTELLCEGTFGELTEAQVGALERVRQNSSRLEALVNDLLVLERAEIGNLDLEFGTLDLRETVHGVTSAFEELLHGRTLDVDIDLATAPVTVYGDRVAMERVLMNLLSNAVKFTPGEGRITVTAATDDGRSVLTVSDTGIGIGEGDQRQLFNRFFRTEEATNRAIPGTGLGLSVVHAIVEGHGGLITVTSKPGHGTTVRVSLPFLEVPATAAPLAVG